MRQAGVIAAAGLYALDHNRDRLVEDHHRAYQLANGLIDIDGIEIDLKTVQTNMIYLQTNTSAVEIVKKLAGHGIDVLAIGVAQHKGPKLHDHLFRLKQGLRKLRVQG